MRLAAPATLALVAGAACGEPATAPLRRVTGAPPSGLPVATTLVETYAPANAFDASVTASGDSVVLAYVTRLGCGDVYAVSAGIADGALVVTNTTTYQGGNCLAISTLGGPTLRAVVRPPARGRLSVILRERRRRQQPGTPEFLERTVAWRTVTLL
jgi:hypothetical protein